jgi:hypothetical protein
MFMYAAQADDIDMYDYHNSVHNIQSEHPSDVPRFRPETMENGMSAGWSHTFCFVSDPTC